MSVAEIAEEDQDRVPEAKEWKPENSLEQTIVPAVAVATGGECRQRSGR